MVVAGEGLGCSVAAGEAGVAEGVAVGRAFSRDLPIACSSTREVYLLSAL